MKKNLPLLNYLICLWATGFGLGIFSPKACAAPPPPTNLTLQSVTATSVTFAWTASRGDKVTQYLIYRDGSNIASVPKSILTFTDNTVAASQQYIYTVKALNSNNVLSIASNAITATTPAGSGVVNGVCGSANGVESASIPTNNLCSSGSASSVTQSTDSWNWTCNSNNGGSNDTCSAPVQPPAVNGTCGLANGTLVTSAPTTNLCTSGVTTGVSGSGPWTWTCSGLNGGTDASCSTQAPSCPVNNAPVGVNLTGNEASWEPLATKTELDYLKSKGVTLIRLPSAWEKIQPTLNGPLDPTEMTQLQNFLTLAASEGMLVIIDIHNYARYNPNWAAQVAAKQNIAEPCSGSACLVLGTSGLPISDLANLWNKLAGTLKGHAGLAGYDLMNEPNTLSSPSVWSNAAQGAINAIRSVDTNTTIVVEGYQWANGQSWVWNNPGFPLTDPSNNIVYEAHSYWDNTSGAYAQPYSFYCPTACPNRGVTFIQPFVQWLQKYKLNGYVGEFGVPGNDPNWLTVLNNFLVYITQNGVAGTYWSYAYDEPVGSHTWWVTINAGGATMSLNLETNGTPPPQWVTLAPYLTSVSNTCWNHKQ